MKQLSLFVSSIIFTSAALAHGGGLDAEGCHMQRGTRHCHGGTGPNAQALNEVQNSDKERRAAHKLACRGTPGVNGSQPTYDLQGQPCKPRDKAR
jgi:hypothetical protein